MESYNDIKGKFSMVKQVANKYDLDVSGIDEVISSIDEFKVTSPIIGNFSTGKSSLLNAIFGKNILKVDVTPETAIPKEIYYGDNHVYQIYKDTITEHSIEELPMDDLTIADTDCIRIEYKNEFLAKIPSVKIIDLPGFNSNIAVHNKAIDRYLPNSMAYILVVSSDEPVIKNNIYDFLKELKLYGLPIYVVITKSSRLSDDEIKECQKLLTDLMETIFDKEEIKIAIAESYGEIDVEQVKEFFYEIQEKSVILFHNKFVRSLKRYARYVEVYLNERIEKKELTSSELELEKAKISKQIEHLISGIKKEEEKFTAQTEDCIKTLQEQIKSSLVQSSSVIAGCISNGYSLDDKLSILIRNAIVDSLNDEFEPKLSTYLKSVEELFDIKYLTDIDLSIDTLATECAPAKYENVAKAAPVIGFLALGVVLNPVVGLIGVTLSTAADYMLNVNNKKKREIKAQKLADELIEKVSKEVADTTAEKIRSYVKTMNQEINQKVLRQQKVLEKSLTDIQCEMSMETSIKMKEVSEMKQELETIQKYLDIELM
ncbi:MAG: dynamin family protein [Clostridiales bacterium]|nr:dynamin family protein [Clostridiales bacterium]